MRKKEKERRVKVSLRIKVVVMTLVLSMALIGSSILISYLIYSHKAEEEIKKDCRTVAESMSERIADFYDDFIKRYAEDVREIYEQQIGRAHV